MPSSDGGAHVPPAGETLRRSFLCVIFLKVKSKMIRECSLFSYTNIKFYFIGPGTLCVFSAIRRKNALDSRNDEVELDVVDEKGKPPWIVFNFTFKNVTHREIFLRLLR
jgi:hypothetical protein